MAGLSAPLYGSAAGHAKYAGLCERCATDEEKDDIRAAIEGGVRKLTGHE